MDSFISWVGGKRALRQIILPLFPVSYDRYIEVFGGAGWMLFYKPPDKFEVFNDFNPELVNLYHVVKEQHLAFLEELRFLPTNSRNDFNLIKSFLKKDINEVIQNIQSERVVAERNFRGEDLNEILGILNQRSDEYKIKRAVAFYKLIHYSYASGCKSVACQPMDITKTYTTIMHSNWRLRNVFIENKDFEAILRHYDRDNSFFYCDPPYYEAEGHYAVEFPKDDHIRLRDTLAELKGKWLVSYNDCEYIRDLYADYNIMAFSRLSNLAQRYEGGAQYAELLIANYDFEERGRLIPQQLTFFDYANEMAERNAL